MRNQSSILVLERLGRLCLNLDAWSIFNDLRQNFLLSLINNLGLQVIWLRCLSYHLLCLFLDLLEAVRAHAILDGRWEFSRRLVLHSRCFHWGHCVHGRDQCDRLKLIVCVPDHSRGFVFLFLFDVTGCSNWQELLTLGTRSLFRE